MITSLDAASAQGCRVQNLRGGLCGSQGLIGEHIHICIHYVFSSTHAACFSQMAQTHHPDSVRFRCRGESMAQMRVHDGTTERDYWQRLMPDAVEKHDQEVSASAPRSSDPRSLYGPAPLTLAVSMSHLCPEPPMLLKRCHHHSRSTLARPRYTATAT